MTPIRIAYGPQHERHFQPALVPISHGEAFLHGEGGVDSGETVVELDFGAPVG